MSPRFPTPWPIITNIWDPITTSRHRVLHTPVHINESHEVLPPPVDNKQGTHCPPILFCVVTEVRDLSPHEDVDSEISRSGHDPLASDFNKSNISFHRVESKTSRVGLVIKGFPVTRWSRVRTSYTDKTRRVRDKRTLRPVVKSNSLPHVLTRPTGSVLKDPTSRGEVESVVPLYWRDLSVPWQKGSLSYDEVVPVPLLNHLVKVEVNWGVLFHNCRQLSCITPTPRDPYPTKSPPNQSPYFPSVLMNEELIPSQIDIKDKVLRYRLSVYPVSSTPCHSWGRDRFVSIYLRSVEVVHPNHGFFWRLLWSPFQTTTGPTTTSNNLSRTNGGVVFFKEDRRSTRVNPLPYHFRTVKE